MKILIDNDQRADTKSKRSTHRKYVRKIAKRVEADVLNQKAKMCRLQIRSRVNDICVHYAVNTLIFISMQYRIDERKEHKADIVINYLYVAGKKTYKINNLKKYKRQNSRLGRGFLHSQKNIPLSSSLRIFSKTKIYNPFVR